ncbi:MAG TPA: hypothetical protein VG015_02440, partial [Candidatus Dormibacteraeota bacterium]|nr:hypothetical protein [Candidatus Dormibacteraeota bacterium]
GDQLAVLGPKVKDQNGLPSPQRSRPTRLGGLLPGVGVFRFSPGADAPLAEGLRPQIICFQARGYSVTAG